MINNNLLLHALDLWANIDCIQGRSDKPCQLGDLFTLINNLVNIALSIAGTVAVLFLIIGGFQYMTSAGDPENIGRAKNTILYAIIGLILIIVSLAIINFITGRF